MTSCSKIFCTDIFWRIHTLHIICTELTNSQWISNKKQNAAFTCRKKKKSCDCTQGRPAQSIVGFISFQKADDSLWSCWPLFCCSLIYSSLCITGELKHAAGCLLIIQQHINSSTNEKQPIKRKYICNLPFQSKNEQNLIQQKHCSALLNNHSCIFPTAQEQMNWQEIVF